MAVPSASGYMCAKDKVHSSRRWCAQWNYGSRTELAIGSRYARFRKAGQRACEIRHAVDNFEIAASLRGARAKITCRQRNAPTFRQGNAPFSRVVRSDVNVRLTDGTIHCNGPMEIESAALRRHKTRITGIPFMRMGK